MEMRSPAFVITGGTTIGYRSSMGACDEKRPERERPGLRTI
jgi:hypothetical protein